MKYTSQQMEQLLNREEITIYQVHKVLNQYLNQEEYKQLRSDNTRILKMEDEVNRFWLAHISLVSREQNNMSSLDIKLKKPQDKWIVTVGDDLGKRLVVDTMEQILYQ